MLRVLSSELLFWSLLGGFVALNVLDGHSTYLVLKPYYYHRERNPVARWVFRKLGLPQGVIVFKGLLLSILVPAMCYYGAHDLFTINIVLGVSGLVFLVVVIHNYRVYHKIEEARFR